MIVLLAAVVLLAVVAGAVVVGALGLGATRGPGGEGSTLAGGVAVAGGAVVVVVLLLVLVGGIGLVGVDRGDGTEDGAEAPAVDGERDTNPIAGRPATYDAEVRVDGGGPGLGVPVVIRALAVGDVVRVRGDGFAGGQTGVVAACDGFGAHRCAALMAVSTDDDGRFDTAYRWTRPGGGALLVDVDGTRSGVVVDGETAPAVGRASVAVEDEVVRVSGLVPGDLVSLARCPDDGGDFGDCRQTADQRVGADGSVAFAVDSSGGERLLVLDGSGTSVASTVVARPSRPPSAMDLDAGRVTAGLAVALLLLLGAVWLVRSTDWRPPAELSVEEVG